MFPPAPLSRIRAHCRIDETYDDALLEAYWVAAIQAAEIYIGKPVTQRRFEGEVTISEAGRFKIPDADVADLEVTTIDGRPLQYRRVTGGRYLLEADPACCTPTLGHYGMAQYANASNRVLVNYRTGPGGSGLDPLVEAGCLKFIAHMYENRGSEPTDSGQTGRNSSVITSGAVEFWNLLKSAAF